MKPIVQTIVFECDDVTAYVVDQKSRFLGNTPIWSGSLRMIEQEAVDSDMDELEVQVLAFAESESESEMEQLPFYLMRLKVELYNETRCGKVFPSGSRRDEVWAELWYNPPSEEYKCTVNGEESILGLGKGQFRLLVQLPGSGFHVLPKKLDPTSQDKASFVQVALGLAFTHEVLRIRFEDTLNQYKRRYRSYEEFYIPLPKPRTADSNSEITKTSILQKKPPLPLKLGSPPAAKKTRKPNPSFFQQGAMMNGNALQENLLRIAMSLEKLNGLADDKPNAPVESPKSTIAQISDSKRADQEDLNDEDEDDDEAFGDFVHS